MLTKLLIQKEFLDYIVHLLFSRPFLNEEFDFVIFINAQYIGGASRSACTRPHRKRHTGRVILCGTGIATR